MNKIKNIENISIEVDNDIIFYTVAKHKLFYSYGKTGMDALLLYLHLMFTARLQQTNSVKAKDIYLREGLNWGAEKLRHAKKLLYQLELIETVQRRDGKGQFIESYIAVKTKKSPFEIEEVLPATLETVTPQTRSTVLDNKCLNEEVKCLNEEENACKTEHLNKKEIEYIETFEKLWSIYNKKVGKDKAYKAFVKVNKSDYDKIFEHVPKYVESTPDLVYRKHLSTYINQKSWNDEIIIKNEKKGFYETEEERVKKLLEERKKRKGGIK